MSDFHEFPLSERIGDSARGFVEAVKIPKVLRARDVSGIKFTIGDDGVTISVDTVTAVLCKASGLDPDVFGDIPAPDLFKMAAAVMGELGKSLPISTKS